MSDSESLALFSVLTALSLLYNLPPSPHVPPALLASLASEIAANGGADRVLSVFQLRNSRGINTKSTISPNAPLTTLSSLLKSPLVSTYRACASLLTLPHSTEFPVMFAFQTLQKRAHGMAYDCCYDSERDAPEANLGHIIASLLSQCSSPSSSSSSSSAVLKAGALAVAGMSVRVFHALHSAATVSNPPPSLLSFVHASFLLHAAAAHSSTFSTALLATFTCLPELIAGCISSRKISISPSFLALLFAQLESESTQQSLLQIVSSLSPPPPPLSTIALFSSWAYYVPPTLPFLSPSLTFALPHLPAQPALEFLISIFDPFVNSEDAHKPRERGKVSLAPTFKVDRTRSALETTTFLLCNPHHPSLFSSLLSSSDPASPGGSAIELLASLTTLTLPHLPPSSPSFRALSSLLLSLSSSLTAPEHSTSRSMLLESVDAISSSFSTNAASSTPELTDLLTQTTLHLSNHCSYPPSYFASPLTEYDFELEVERNAIRDLLRAVASSPNATLNFLDLCAKDLAENVRETTAHTFSALAKNIFAHGVENVQHVQQHETAAGSSLSAGSSSTPEVSAAVVDRALRCFEILLATVMGLIQSADINPNKHSAPSNVQLYRITCLAVSSNVALFSRLLSDPSHFHYQRTSSIVQRAAEFACITCTSIREYPHAVRDLNQFLNTGVATAACFHSPGGEDHLGCLCLNRLCLEGGGLLPLMGEGIGSLTAVHDFLLKGERERENVVGPLSMMTTGKSRRLVLQGIGHVCVQANNGEVLKRLVEGNTSVIGKVLRNEVQITGAVMRAFCDSVLDFAEFEYVVIESNLAEVLAIGGVITWGFEQASGHAEDVLPEWARVRVAFHCLVKSVIKEGKGHSLGVDNLRRVLEVLEGIR